MRAISAQTEGGSAQLHELISSARRRAIATGEFWPLCQMEGMEVVVFGVREADSIATRFVVRHLLARSWGGGRVHDGILRREREGDLIELRDGQRLRIGRLPAELAHAADQRVLLAGSLDAPSRGKVIEPAPRPGQVCLEGYGVGERRPITRQLPD